MARINEAGLAIIEEFESCVLFAYDDAVYPSIPFQEGDTLIGTLTIGYGHTGPDVKPGMRCTNAQADAWLMSDVATAEHTVSSAVEIGLTPNQYSALVSFVFNVGIGNFLSSTMLRQLNSSNLSGASNSFMDWIYANNAVDEGLVRRRQAEQHLFNTPG